MNTHIEQLQEGVGLSHQPFTSNMHIANTFYTKIDETFFWSGFF